MTDAAATAPPPPKRSMLRRLLPVVAALLLGAGGFAASWFGVIELPGGTETDAPEDPADFAFVPIHGLTVTLGPRAQSAPLLFSAEIEVRPESLAAMMRMKPRFLDVLNSYLRALEPEEIAEPAALIRLRAQMLRRLQIVAGEGHVRDLLITEFVLH